MPRHRSPLIAENGIQGNGYVSPRVFGGKGDGAADDTTALQNAINAAKILPGGGTVIIDGQYRITSALSMDAHVSIEGVGADATSGTGPALFIDHATNGIFAWTTNGGGNTKGRIKNLLLSALQANTGNILDMTNGLVLNLLLDNVAVNVNTAGLLQGRVLGYEATAHKIAMRNCKIHVAGAAKSFLVMDLAGATMTLTDCELRTPTSYNAKFIDVQAGTLNMKGCDLLAGLTPVTANCPFVNLGSTSSSATVLGNSFRGLDSNIQLAYAWSAAGRLIARDNTYDNGLQILTFSGNPGPLALHSRLELSPYDHFFDASGAPQIPPLYDEVTFELSNAAPTLALPYILYPGQKLRINILNSSGGSMTPAFSSHVTMATVNALANTGVGSYLFGVSDVVTPSTYQWTLLGVSNS